MSRTCSNMAISILLITLKYISMTYCAESGNDPVPPPAPSHGKGKLFEMSSTAEDIRAAEIIQSLRKGKEVLTHRSSPDGEGSSRAAASSALDFAKKKQRCKPNYRRWTGEMNDDLLYLYYSTHKHRTEKWSEIENIFRQKYGEDILREDMQKHVTDIVNRMVYDTKRPIKGRIKKDPRVDLIRIYYQTRDGDESEHNYRMRKRWFEENLGSQNLFTSDPKTYVEKMLAKIKKLSSERRKGEEDERFSWTQDHEANLLEIWNSFPPEMENKMKELHRIMSQRFSDIGRLPIHRVYTQLHNLLRRNKRLSKDSKSDDQTAHSNQRI